MPEEKDGVAWEGPTAYCSHFLSLGPCEDRVLDGPASGEKGSKGRN